VENWKNQKAKNRLRVKKQSRHSPSRLLSDEQRTGMEKKGMKKQTKKGGKKRFHWTHLKCG